MAHSEGTLVVARHTELITAYDLQTGEIKWQEDVPDRGYTPLTARSDTLFTDLNSHVSAYDIHSGRFLWSIDPERIVGRMALGDDSTLYMVLGHSESTTIAALDTNARTFLWETGFPSSQVTVSTYLTLDNNTLYVASDQLAAISVENGQIIWVSESLPALKQPVVTGNTVYVISENSRLYAFDRSTGAQLGGLSLSGRPSRSFNAALNPSVAGELLLVQTDTGTISAFELENQ
jgi:outer membrane protein assembly factor BamB